MVLQICSLFRVVHPPKLGLFLLFASLYLQAHSQDLSIGGKIKDDQNNAIGYANLALQLCDGNKNQVRQLFSDSTGHYRFTQLKAGKYLLTVSALGFSEKKSDTIVLDGKTVLFSYDLTLAAATKNLKGVTVTYQVPKIETEKGKLVFNLQNSALTSGQNALDVLSRLPGVSIDQNENILFKGAAGVNVMIDGRMTYLSGSQLANYLKGLSAADLSKIELISAPPAEFDAAGNAGMINIVSKKKTKPGYAIDLRSVVSKAKYWMANENILASFNTSKLNLFGMFDFNTPHTYSSNQSGNTIPGSSGLQFRRTNIADHRIYYYTWRGGINWQFLPQHQVGASYHGYLDDFKAYKTTRVNTIDNSSQLQSYILSNNKIIEPYRYHALNLNYKFAIDSTGKKITADADFTSYKNYSDALMRTQNFNGADQFLGEDQLRSSQPGFVKIKSFKVDADLPFKTIGIKGGLKYAAVSNDNEYRFEALQSGSFVEIPEMSNHFKYKEQIAAAYLSADKKFNKTAVYIGLRLEHTNANGYNTDQNLNKWSYTQLFPSLAIEQELNGNDKVELSLSRRINRPSYTDLNPVRWYSDPYFYYSGNAQLVPELAWAYALFYTINKKYILSASYNHSNNFINRRLVVDGTAIKSQSANFGNMNRFDFSASIPVKLFDYWQLQLFASGNYTTYPISLLKGEKQLSQWAASASLQQDFLLPANFKASVSTYYYSPELRGIYLTKSAYFTDFGLKKAMLSSRLNLQFTLTDIFNTNRFRAVSQTNITDYFYNDKPYSRRFSFSLSYHIGGKMTRPASKKTEEQERL